ncbi:hypothetical protein RRG08_029749 [Elysia crispata]|uniref:Uncharacterized protein n=1 Tax=Elysia crispata TaxID=231223 RepID=A0AAE1EAL7_9GAST|nr:hypothetical protein RRG08_029749 [Elysia crispata]
MGANDCWSAGLYVCVCVPSDLARVTGLSQAKVAGLELAALTGHYCRSLERRERRAVGETDPHTNTSGSIMPDGPLLWILRVINQGHGCIILR